MKRFLPTILNNCQHVSGKIQTLKPALFALSESFESASSGMLYNILEDRCIYSDKLVGSKAREFYKTMIDHIDGSVTKKLSMMIW